MRVFICLCAVVSLMDSARLNAQAPAIKKVKIGTQSWMALNLNVEKFRNGDPIPQAKTAEEWKKASDSGKPAWCYHSNDPANGIKYGKLYNWYAVNDPRGLAPKGWHIPTDEEWEEMIQFLGKQGLAQKIKSIAGWRNFETGGYTDSWSCEYCQGSGTMFSKLRGRYITCTICGGVGSEQKTYPKKVFSGNGKNSSGFSGVPGGWRKSDGKFSTLGETANWWTVTPSYGPRESFYRGVVHDSDDITIEVMPMGFGFSVRCIEGPVAVPYKLNSGGVDTLKIGAQTWMIGNLNVSTFQNGDSIPEVSDPGLWASAGEAGKPAWSYYLDNTDNSLRLGKLYNGYAAVDPRGLCPVGWHVPEQSEWETLIKNLGGSDSAAIKLKNSIGWYEFGPERATYGNKSGFSALPGGSRSSSGVFLGLDDKRLTNGYWWSSTLPFKDKVINVGLKSNDGKVFIEQSSQAAGRSVRCLKGQPMQKQNDVILEEEIFTVVDQSASPEGGMPSFYRFIGNKLRYPSQANRQGIEGKVFVSFVINKDGTLVDIKVERGIGGGCDEEAVRLIKDSPPWIPGKIKGKPVRQRYTLPIQFRLQ